MNRPLMQYTTEKTARAPYSATVRTIVLPHPEPSITALLSHQASVRPDETAAISADGRSKQSRLQARAQLSETGAAAPLSHQARPQRINRHSARPLGAR
jgi:hypothetical protein